MARLRKRLDGPKLIICIGLLASAIFVLDITSPLGVAGGVPYVAVVLVSLSSSENRFPSYVAGVVTLLTIIGHFLSPIGSELWVDYVNRALAVFAIWVTTVISIRRKEADEARSRVEELAGARERLALVGEMAAGVAHEIRNPLDGVINCISLLRSRGGIAAEDRELLDLAETGLKRIEGISSRMLHLGREDLIRKVPTQIESVIDLAMSFILIRAEREKISVRRIGSQQTKSINVDPEKLSEVLVNLLVNAADACKSGGSVTVRARDISEGNKLEIAVWDDGGGVPLALRTRIFEPFFSTKPVGKGSGLGLPIARRIVENHGGSLELVDSHKGGALFKILLPRDGVG